MHDNKVHLTGHLFGTPTIHKDKKVGTWVQCTVMVECAHRNHKGHQFSGTLAINVVIYDDIAERCFKHLARRQAVVVEGRLSLFNNIENSGQNKGGIEITASRISVIQDKTRRFAP
ncbi:single-stranded DNA-binding protein [Paraflavitalea sp. CAU 1676]|uniref:single-stranded DNA-binding protein n=1 Tax=Paraflavitalea sp. CAU 1676 TaxID=3032598 RepID=UPI0023DA862F|nr:single-stranded DNA-binding protein [Paraflavitalea sp. CAU 1676]MDF2188539.1 single-stranded DNA-binding protein [Paraflavitalea sp. CAU 1676]